MLIFCLNVNQIQNILISLLEKSLKPGFSHQEFKGALYILSRVNLFKSWTILLKLYPTLVQAQHSDKESIVDLLKVLSNRYDPTHEDYVLWTISLKPAIMSQQTAKYLGVLKPWQGNKIILL